MGADCLVTLREGTVTYLTGYTTSTWSNHSRPVVAVLWAGGRVSVVCAETEADAVRERMPAAEVHAYVELRPVEPTVGLPDGRVQFVPHAAEVLGRVLDGVAPERIAVDGLRSAYPPIGQLAELLPGLHDAAIDASPAVWDARLLKSPWEVERMRDACDVLDRAFGLFGERLEGGMTEREIHGLLGAASFEAGADRLGYTNIVAGVERELFGAPTDRRWERGDVLYVDGGVVVDGYWADFCRMYTVGAPTSAQADGYRRCREAQLKACEQFAPGATAGDLGRTIASALDLAPGAVGFGRFGHGIGLYMPEPPSLHPQDDTPLADGTVLCIEPALLHEGANYVVEEEHLVDGGRLTRLSPPAPDELLAI
jgi:Xaa-Pro aminopeptidase